MRAFEAVARRLITIAATEPHVTPGAVSRQIRSARRCAGIQLLVRGHRQITLTRAGEDYYRAVTKAMDGLREATVRLTRRTRRTQLKVRRLHRRSRCAG